MKKGYGNLSFLAIAEAKKIQEDGVKKRTVGRPKKPNMKQFTIRMEASVHSSLKDFAFRTGEDTSSIIQRVMKDFLANQKTD